MSTRPSIALCMIMKNEEEHLPRLFKSIENCFDEIHITDTGSTDKSVEVAKKLGATVHHFDWVNDFSAARNYSFSQAKTDYIMWLDLDDELVNAKSFIGWRDHAMGLADYWLARYDYATDPNTGKVACYFARERVVKNNIGMKWRYPIHEGIVPLGGAKSAKSEYTKAFHIKHCRTAEDLNKDRSRNLNLFETLGDKLDARMRYYYGKELFEVQRPVEAAAELMKALKEPNLELHDKVLAYQYACYCYLQCGQFDKVIEIAMDGLKHMPHRAELWCLVGDAYLKKNKIADAIPAFAAAKSCLPPNKNVPTPIFSHEHTYNIYPGNQMAKIYANLGDLDKAYLIAKDVKNNFQNAETDSILEELSKVKRLAEGYKTAVSSDDILISCPMSMSYKWNPDVAKTQHMGGSETAVIEMAKYLSEHSGRNVLVFNDTPEEKQFGKVRYIPHAKLGLYCSEYKPYMHIAWRHNIKITDAPTFLWCHDLSAAGIENHNSYTKVLALSSFHKNFLVNSFGIPEEKVYVTRNGIMPDRFLHSSPVIKNPNKIIYASSPDRGLDRTIQVLDLVRQKHKDVELHCFYGIEQLKAYGKDELYNYLKSMITSRPWIKFHGGVSQDELMRHEREASIWLYPTDFLETFCITALEMVGNGVYPIVRDYGALPDTLTQARSLGIAEVIDRDCTKEDDFKFWADRVCEALDEKKWEKVNMDMATLGWDGVARDWLKDFPYFFSLTSSHLETLKVGNL